MPEDPNGISSYQDLHEAITGLWGRSNDRSVESRTGLSKTTINDLRNRRRRLTEHSVTRIVEAFDPARRTDWLAAWYRLQRTAGLGTEPDAGPAEAGTGAGPERGTDRDADEPPAAAVGAPPATAPPATALPATGPSASNPAEPVPARPGEGRPVRPVQVLVVAAVGLLGVGLGAGIGLGALLFGGSTASTAMPAPRTAAGPSGCYHLPLTTTATIVDQRGAGQYGVRVSQASYTYHAAWNPSLEVGGKLSAPVPAGKELVGAGWADPGTTDSTPRHNPGNGRYYPGDVLTVSEQLCFRGPRGLVGYPGYPGITTRIYLMLVDKGGATVLARDAERLDGFTDRDLAVRGADIIGYFDVPSATMTPPAS
ncbi:XRE family transcriptional regulator [Frankia sp. R82]|uniref:XRE family transcriptional regulator n=1 Tax=Frankia sp. R82 TaxID=2950553 RepID=UPI0020435A01|nr:XRE family transcriptional regulator [Frankia sp. R82]MCM3882771.1 XRE family transcriptional regulator [Frankia sp. R82]